MAKSEDTHRLLWDVTDGRRDLKAYACFITSWTYRTGSDACEGYWREEADNRLLRANSDRYDNDLCLSARVYTLAYIRGNYPALAPGRYRRWHDRERKNIIRGYYKLLPWGLENWWLNRIIDARHECAFHFATVSREDPTKLSYVPDDKHGQNDRRLRIRPGRYLKRFFGDVLSNDEIERLAADFAGQNANDYTLGFATEPDEIESVYVNGPHSCMSGDASDFDHGIHPSRAYGAGDLAIAYIKRGSRITARCVCWPENKIFSIVYGDAARLMRALEKEGFRKQHDGYDGARLLRIELDEERLVAPYLDIEPSRATESGERLVLDCDGKFQLRTTCGYVDQNTFICPSCDDWRHAGYAQTVWLSETNEAQWCAECADQYTFVCDHDNRLYSESHVEMVQLGNGERWAQHNADAHTFECEGSGEMFPNDERITITGHNGEMTVSQDWAYDYNTRTCDQCCTVYVEDMVSRDIDGLNVCDSCRESKSPTESAPESATAEARAI